MNLGASCPPPGGRPKFETHSGEPKFSPAQHSVLNYEVAPKTHPIRNPQSAISPPMPAINHHSQLNDIDTVIFDVDGVLWDAQAAYIRCGIHVTERFCAERGLPHPRLTFGDVMAFKRAGGFNSDWDTAWTLVVLARARASGRIPTAFSWSDLAAESGGEGMTWARRYADANAPDFDSLQQVFDAYYWGADRYPIIYDRQPVLHFRPGFAEAERPFAAPDLMVDLRRVGVRSVGIITGRNRNEMRSVFGGLDFDGLLNPDAIFTDEDGHKPDPELLRRAIQVLDANRVIMVGDSIDDLRTVLHYRQLSPSLQTAKAFAVQVAPDTEAEFWLDQGADAVIPSVNKLPSLLTGRSGDR